MGFVSLKINKINTAVVLRVDFKADELLQIISRGLYDQFFLSFSAGQSSLFIPGKIL